MADGLFQVIGDFLNGGTACGFQFRTALGFRLPQLRRFHQAIAEDGGGAAHVADFIHAAGMRNANAKITLRKLVHGTGKLIERLGDAQHQQPGGSSGNREDHGDRDAKDGTPIGNPIFRGANGGGQAFFKGDIELVNRAHDIGLEAVVIRAMHQITRHGEIGIAPDGEFTFGVSEDPLGGVDRNRFKLDQRIGILLCLTQKREFRFREASFAHHLLQRDTRAIRARCAASGRHEIPIDAVIIHRARLFAIANPDHRQELFFPFCVARHHIGTRIARDIVRALAQFIRQAIGKMLVLIGAARIAEGILHHQEGQQSKARCSSKGKAHDNGHWPNS